MAFVDVEIENHSIKGEPDRVIQKPARPLTPPKYSSPQWDDRRFCYLTSLGYDWKAWDPRKEDWVPLQTWDNSEFAALLPCLGQQNVLIAMLMNVKVNSTLSSTPLPLERKKTLAQNIFQLYRRVTGTKAKE